MKQLGLTFVGIFIWVLILTGCSVSDPSEHEPSMTPTISPISESTNIGTEYIKLLPQEAQAMMSEDVIILDVRTEEEYDEGHIPDAILLPNYEIQDKAETVIADKKATILVYCRTGRRSENASKELINMGYEKVYDIGGIVDWTGEIVGHWLYPSYYNYFGGALPADIYTLIDFTMTKKINDQVPEFTYHLIGNKVERYGVSSDETKYYIIYDENQIERITITDDKGALIQIIDNIITGNPASEGEMYGLSFEDWNFDGFIDIGLWSYPGGSMRNDPHYYWLWDNSLGQFVVNSELMEISDYNSVSVNYEEKRLEVSKSLGNFGYMTQHFEYLDHKFALVYSYTLEILPSPEEDDKDIRHIIVEELIDGEVIVTEEYYEDLE